MDKIQADNLIKSLISANITISCMESCTAGMIASIITDTEGASAVFKGSYVTYSNEEKIRMGVNADVIRDYGVYSRECASEMAWVVKRDFKVDVAIGITGNTGNTDVNNPKGKVGEVFFCIIKGDEEHTYSYKIDVKNLSRHEIKKAYAYQVFTELSELLK